MKNEWNYCNPKRPLDIIFPSFQRVHNIMYHTIAKKNQSIYTDKDAIMDYQGSKILSPNEVSYFNLFVNGIIQPLITYKIEKGKLIFLTENLPIVHTPITLQFIIFY